MNTNVSTPHQPIPHGSRAQKLDHLRRREPQSTPSRAAAKSIALTPLPMISARSESFEAMSTQWKQRARKGLFEVATMARATLSSALATLVDGVVYQVALTLFVSHYGAAAFAGALLGGVTNFTVNRFWAFRNTIKPLGAQASEYALASLTTYVALQSCLFALVEVLHTDQRVAWIPAKVVAWLFVSYPLHRFLVFGSLKTRPSQALALSGSTIVPEPVPAPSGDTDSV